MEKSPWPCDSMPRPWQRGQTFGDVPGFAPVPVHVEQTAEVDTLSGTCAPSTACWKLMVAEASRSRPRSGRGCDEVPPPRPDARPKRSDRMSPKPPASKPPAPPPPPPNGLPPANGLDRI